MSSEMPSKIAELTGPMFLASIINWFLLGALIVQTYIYYVSFPRDKRITKIVVGLAFIMELCQVVLATRDAFRIFVLNWGNPVGLNEMGFLWISVAVCCSTISCTVQLFYAWRIFTFCKKHWLPAVIVSLSVMQAIAGVWTGGLSRTSTLSELKSKIHRITPVWLCGTALCDLTIAASMLYYLTKSRSGFRATNVMLAKILQVTIESGVLCATFAILHLALFLRYPQENYHVTFAMALSKLYSNSLLAVLNTRVKILEGRGSFGIPQELALPCLFKFGGTNLGHSSPGHGSLGPGSDKSISEHANEKIECPTSTESSNV